MEITTHKRLKQENHRLRTDSSHNLQGRGLSVRLARRETGLSPPVKYFTDHSKAVLLLWIIYVISVLFL